MATKAASSGYTWQKSRPIAEQSCSRVYDLVETHREYRGYRITETTYIHYSYASPADGERRINRQLLDEQDHGRALNIGDEVGILVNVGDAEPIRIP